jgi:CMP-N,N'-diacetyllegionaminic acid synthase
MTTADSEEPVVAAIIPARGGSQGVIGKNMRLLGDKPLIHYAIDAAKRAKKVSLVVVSTEDEAIAQYAVSVGAKVLRHPAILSTDSSATYPVIRWALRELEQKGYAIDLCAVLRATTPLRTAEDIDNAISILITNPDADSVVSVRPAIGIHPIRLKRVEPDGRLVDAFEEEGNSPKRRQELEPLYLRNGGIYLARRDVVITNGLWGGHCLAYVMPEERSVNINTEYDFLVAQLLLTRPDA